MLQAADLTPLIPAQHMTEAMLRYIYQGKPPGDFLLSVLSNDLARSCKSADFINKLMLVEWVHFLTTYAPPECWGNSGAVDSWMRIGGYLGKYGEILDD